MEAALGLGASWPGAVAVSGGGDSTALLLLLVDWARTSERQAPIVLTVDHGLRPDASREATEVARRARARNLEAHVLRWRGRKPRSNVEGAAREARYRLMGEWCLANDIGCLYVAHTIDDQAETFLLRLARGSGVDGLAGMAEVSSLPSPASGRTRVARPLLGVSRKRLRAFLEARGETWLEDEMNSEPQFARVRLRAAWPAFEGAGLSAERVAGAARHLARARAALDHDSVDLLSRAARRSGEGILLDGTQIAAAPEEIGLRALASVLMQIAGRSYRPRFERLERLFEALRAGTLGAGRTLHGCSIRPARRQDAGFGPGTVRISREAERRGAVRYD